MRRKETETVGTVIIMDVEGKKEESIKEAVGYTI